MISAELVERLRYEGESDALDFKSAQYEFVAADDEAKSELLKDILAFANSWRRTDAYILIGVREVQGGPAEIVGLSSHLDDADLQQFVNSKTQRPLRFAYSALQVEGKDIAAIHVPLQERPFFLSKRFGRLEADVVYVRRGSSTARAKPDEVARMGREESPQHDIDLDVFFADPRFRKPVTPTIHSHVLDLPDLRSIPDYTPRQVQPFPYVGHHTRAEYYRELVRFTKINRLVSPVWFAIANAGGTTALDVRIEVAIPGATDGVWLLDEHEYPDVPRAQFDVSDLVTPRSITHMDPDLTVARVGDQWMVSARADKVQPRSTEWFVDPVYIGAETSRHLECSVKVFADNLRMPHEQTLSLTVEAAREDVDLERIIELETERFENSPEHRSFLREHGYDQE